MRKPGFIAVRFSLAQVAGFMMWVCLGVLLSACGKVDDPSIEASAQSLAALNAPVEASESQTAAYHATRQLYWGDVHIHSSLSYDAYTLGVRTLPDDAWRYMKGEGIEHGGGYTIRAKRPLDFGAVTDHAEYLGVPRHLAGDVASDNDFREALQSGQPLKITWAFIRAAVLALAPPGQDQNSLDDAELAPVSIAAWQQIIQAAEQHNEPGRFTAFIGYEWTSMPGEQNLHRNVIYRGAEVPAYPFSSLDSENPEDLWTALENQRSKGMDNIAIPHNGNVSNGLMYQKQDFAGKALDATYANRRMANEPISEILQVKGASETHPDLSPDDEFADFGLYEQKLSKTGGKPEPKGGYVRDALRSGIELAHAEGFNPYRFGFIGSSDGHNASSPVEEDNYHGKLPAIDGSAGMRLGETLLIPDEQNRGGRWYAMGLAAVWAEENSRAAIFDAMRRKETYATSGPRIGLRFFAGASMAALNLENPDDIAAAYRQGVPMGGALAGPLTASPEFSVLAFKDPIGANLDRIQIIKGWVDNSGASQEKIFNIAASDGREPGADGRLSPLISTVDVGKASYSNSIGSTVLRAHWRDPDFKASEEAFYYVRVLEIPTPRSTTYDAVALGVDAPAPATHQERAISSAIWYSPN